MKHRLGAQTILKCGLFGHRADLWPQLHSAGKTHNRSAQAIRIMLSWIRNLLGPSNRLRSGVVSIAEALSNPEIHSDLSTQAVFTQPEELDYFFDSYAFIQRPDWVGPMLDFLSKQDEIPVVAFAGLSGFLAEVIRQNPSLDSEWNSKLTYACPALRNVYARARELTPEAIFQMESSTENNDLFRSAFRGSGNLLYVGKVIDAMRLIEFGSDRGQLEAGVSAKWSLAAHLQGFLRSTSMQKRRLLNVKKQSRNT